MTAARSLPVVQTAGLGKTFKDFWRRPSVEAVKDLDLEIKPGEVFGLLGPNGSGKTTTIKMLLGLLYPTKGRISVFGRAPTDVAVKSRIGFLPEESYLYRFLVAHETLDYYGSLFRLPRRIRRERTEHLLDMVGLRHESKRRMGEYSKGMARRIGLAQALINDPELLILDEPTSGLDPIGARQIKDVIRDLGRKGKTILLSSHILSDVEDVCDRVTILYGGQQRAAGDISELLSKKDATQITLPSVSEETIAAIRDLVKRLEKKDILDVTRPRVRLEEFFLQIVEEARSANIQTSGARGGGAIPSFLKKATVSTTDEIIDSLIGAASHHIEPTGEPASPELQADPSREVIEHLLHSSDKPQDVSEAVATFPKVETPVCEEPEQPPIKRTADASIIDELLGRSEAPEREDDKP